VKNPNPINMRMSEDVRADGWQGETRDADGHLCRVHAPFETDAEIIWFVREAMGNGEAVTIWLMRRREALK
jgi:molybdopterin synthase sulfur carrier subunit